MKNDFDFNKLKELISFAKSNQDHIEDCILAAYFLGEGRDEELVNMTAFSPHHQKPKFNVIDGGKK